MAGRKDLDEETFFFLEKHIPDTVALDTRAVDVAAIAIFSDVSVIHHRLAAKKVDPDKPGLDEVHSDDDTDHSKV